MLLFTNDPIKASTVPSDQPFQPGEVFVVRYMGLPTIVTVMERTDIRVKVWFDSVPIDEFNQRVLFKLGTRAKFLGLWLPVVACRPQRVFTLAWPTRLPTTTTSGSLTETKRPNRQLFSPRCHPTRGLHLCPGAAIP